MAVVSATPSPGSIATVPADRRVLLLAFDGVQALDLFGPAEVLHTAARVAGGGYRLEVVAPRSGGLRTSSGMRFGADLGLEQATGPVDTLLVAGGPGARDVERDRRTVAWVRDSAGRARRVASVCTGAFVLARAGLLDGRRATTHWAACAQLARRFPAVRVEPDPIYVRDGAVATSAGVTAGMDLALALVEEDLGSEVALRVARALVLFVRRPGGQAQFSAALAGQACDRAPLREAQAWAADHLDADLSVPALAARSFMSPRHFARIFRRETGTTPAAWVEALRVERARLLLETTDAPLEAVARRCGFGTSETMRRAFHRRSGVNPAAYRARFSASA